VLSANWTAAICGLRLDEQTMKSHAMVGFDGPAWGISGLHATARRI